MVRIQLMKIKRIELEGEAPFYCIADIPGSMNDFFQGYLTLFSTKLKFYSKIRFDEKFE